MSNISLLDLKNSFLGVLNNYCVLNDRLFIVKSESSANIDVVDLTSGYTEMTLHPFDSSSNSTTLEGLRVLDKKLLGFSKNCIIFCMDFESCFQIPKLTKKQNINAICSSCTTRAP